MPSDEPSRPYNWRLKSLAKLKSLIKKEGTPMSLPFLYTNTNVSIR